MNAADPPTAVGVDELLAQVDRLPDWIPTQTPKLNKVRYTHEAMIDMIMAEPDVTQNALGQRFGYSPSWVSTIIASDAFKAKLAERREAIVDPILRLKVTEQLEGLMLRSIELLREKLRVPNPPDQLVLRSLELTSRAAGYGARTEQKVTVNVSQTIEAHGEQLVGLLRRKKAEVFDAEVVANAP